MVACTRCATPVADNEVLISAAGPVCPSCHLGAEVDDLMSQALTRKAWTAVGLAVVGGPIQFSINNINVVAVVASPIAIIIAVSTLRAARASGQSKPTNICIAAIVVAVATFALAFRALA